MNLSKSGLRIYLTKIVTIIMGGLFKDTDTDIIILFYIKQH